VTVTAKVSSGASGGLTPTGGMVDIYLNQTASNPGTLLAAAPLTNGAASCTVSSLVPGHYTLTAVYLGTAGFAPSTSSASNQTVNPASTKTSLSVQASTIVYGQSLTLTAKVANTSSSITPTGTVTFMDGRKTLGSCALSNGVATFTIATLQGGNHNLTAVYSGSSYFSSSNSGGVGAKVNPAATAVALTLGPNPATVGQPVTLTATITNLQSGATPTGQVTFEVNGTVIGTANVANGVAILTTTFAASGDDTITAIFGSSADFAGSSATALETVS
jgi:hypothetical protein